MPDPAPYTAEELPGVIQWLSIAGVSFEGLPDWVTKYRRLAATLEQMAADRERLTQERDAARNEANVLRVFEPLWHREPFRTPDPPRKPVVAARSAGEGGQDG